MTTRARIILAVWLLLLAGLFALPVAGGLYEARTMEGSCLSDIAQPLTSPDDSADWDVRARISAFPLGLECTFTNASGAAVVVGPGWLLTIFAGVAGLFGLAAVSTLVWRSRRPAAAERSLAGALHDRG
ncbi:MULTISPECIES: hypothetical protein [unclassified Rathayibacter]|uniref:hypothetical protein n=1 Tax=unclassified Rathayibacter TaxID=2609250 RepID=UPI00188D613F|nr:MULTISPECIES: hypothetical protein [unclassified Rathayibacter]MBF4463230.1 hypothetical protein [Rathayibacter sp. VKM Ac-2879]MBF4504533.1 hypothetical protein [Rathayibacter sp. VKM Ac-2878]